MKYFILTKQSLSILILTLLISFPLMASVKIGLFEYSLEELMDIEIITTSKYKEKINDSPANIYVYNRQQIKQRGYRNIEDLLLDVPGVDVQKYSVPSFLNTITFRGILGNNKFLILQDGVRLSSPAGEQTTIGNNYPLYYAKRVEVLMGPASVVYGADAFMGVINIITMDDKKDHADISITTGTDGYSYIYNNIHQNFSNNSQLTMGLQRYRSQQYQFAQDFPELYNGPNKSINFSDTEQYQFYANYKLNKNWQFGLNHSSHSNSEDFTVKPARSQFDVGATEKINQTTVFTRFNTDISNDLKSTTLLTLMNYELDNRTYFNNLFSGFVPGYKYAISKRVSLNQDIEFKINETHLISGGMVYDYFYNIPKGNDLASPYNTSKSTHDQNQFYANTTLAIPFFENKYHNIGIYAQDNWKLGDKWRFITGLRYDANSFYGNTTNPRISLINRVDAFNVFKVSYGHAFLAPAPDQAYTNFGSFTGAQNGSGEWISTAAAFRVPNPDLKPEKVQTLELNYEHWFDKNSYLKVAPFINRVTDVILAKVDAVPDQAIPGADLQKTSKFDNVGKSESYGIDLTLNNQITTGGFQFKNWGSVSFVDGELINQGQKTELPMTAKYKLKMGSTIIYHKDYILTPKIVWIGTTTSRQPDPNDKSKFLHTPTYLLVDLLAKVKVTPAFSLQLNIYNVFDNKYVNAPFSLSFIAFDQAPQPGRLTTFTMNYQF